MTFVKPGGEEAAAEGLSSNARAETDRTRSLLHATVDLRAGLPCALNFESDQRLLLAAAETVTPRGLDELMSVASGASVHLLLAPGRMPRRNNDVAAFELAASELDSRILRGLADPTAPQVVDLDQLSPIRPPAGIGAAIALAKRARLLPALLAVPLPDTMDTGTLSVVEDTAVLDNDAHGSGHVERVADAAVPLTEAPDSRVVIFRAVEDGIEHSAVLIGRPEEVSAPLVRIHSECFTGDLLGSLRCDCGPQLHGAIQRMMQEGAGVLLYLAQEGRGIGLVNKLRAYAMQDRGLDTLDANRALGWGADERDYGIAASMMHALGIARVRLLTNNPRKIGALSRAGIGVERVSHLFASNGVNDAYLAAKVARFGHLGAE